jgi:hypothetical protein
MSFHKKNQHKCEWCYKKFAKLTMLKNHLKQNCDKIDGLKRKRLSKFACEFCKQFTTDSKVLLKKHVYSVHERAEHLALKKKKNLKASSPTTAKTGQRRSSLRLAMSGIKSSTKKLRCSKCKELFFSWLKFDAHDCCQVMVLQRRLFE